MSVAAQSTRRAQPQYPRIVALATTAPDYAPEQSVIFDKVFRSKFGDVPRAEEIFCNVGVKTRHAFYDPSKEGNGDQKTTAERMQIWKQGAMELGRRAIGTAIADIDKADIGSFVMASCTGYDTPSPDILLAKELALSAALRRTFIGHVGCHAAFVAIKSALDSLAARPEKAVLVNCTEICSAHVRTSETTIEQIVCQALFGDASAALVLSNDPDSNGPEILCTHTETLYAGWDQLGWSIRDDGFRMSLSPLIPHSIGRAVEGFVERMLEPLGIRRSDVQHWGIHPGGPKIVEAVARALSLPEEKTTPSLGILADYGNCSSSTILLILERILETECPQPGEHGVLLAFGPGLTMEGMVLRF